MHTVRVWDLPTRLFHWVLAVCVVAQLITANVGGNWMNWHLRVGYAVLTLLLFRLVWGFVGGHWSRFSSFAYAPRVVWSYLRGRSRSPEHRVGHNPLGALSVFALLAILLAQVGTGLFSDDEIAFTGPLVAWVSGDTVSLATSYHKSVGKLFVLVLVALHLLAIGYYKLVKKERLVRPMIDGDKQVRTPVPSARDTTRTRLLALAVLTLCAVAVNRLVGLGVATAF
ncbi:cytochrome b/b6 domain-containing protein [Hydrogenophaga taeniospiralis]|uniref:cytochrome b/b6 domain-containing protein n=1 Tax=Hydrogenophaga taeniospiralis TaxID=65656 RepID=UPI001CFBA49C|nr:cytochrome b/b6 domain-containing protein [Hydrogenophaga taeniospiralis]MCB4363160.1 cytochrome b/b6 domain-containing protein [Hydrogenophaga taeniospiralis]